MVAEKEFQVKSIARIVLLLVIAGIIYSFSSQTYEEQSLVPMMQKVLPGEPFADVLSQFKVMYWGKEISVETKGYYYFLEFFIRKFAHLLLFGLLAVALFRVYLLWKPDRFFGGILVALIGTGIYAAFDEWHQLQTGGRTPLVNDVFLDLAGGLIALLLYMPFYWWRRIIWRKKNSDKNL
ncbi:VanZ family protein [Pseudobacillus wudalianchiensis]|uniref:Antibiotic resistance protein VanZ n=1 Tax=Pseudobacillus wudalianchiensis TaxID=1743143 RepID=A0A1B9AYR1_9BACI|nr:VanZ family protein [Bacillus wudalianchiensis]OCA88940.1 antibiotic resistance protein VanZ [Bacillus wudalianchiensis]